LNRKDIARRIRPEAGCGLAECRSSLVIAGRAVDFAGGVRCAADAIDSGAGLRLLAQLRQLSRKFVA